jgi:hypothetical protein
MFCGEFVCRPATLAQNDERLAQSALYILVCNVTTRGYIQLFSHALSAKHIILNTVPVGRCFSCSDLNWTLQVEYGKLSRGGVKVKEMTISKKTEVHIGFVEFLLGYNNPILSGQDPNIKHIEKEPFRNLSQLLALLDMHTQTTLRHAHLADFISIHSITMQGNDSDTVQTEISVDDMGMYGSTSLTISPQDITDHSTKLLICTENGLRNLLEQLHLHNEISKSEGEQR